MACNGEIQYSLGRSIFISSNFGLTVKAITMCQYYSNFTVNPKSEHYKYKNAPFNGYATALGNPFLLFLFLCLNLQFKFVWFKFCPVSEI